LIGQIYMKTNTNTNNEKNGIVPKIEIIFEIDNNGCIIVCCSDLNSGEKNSIIFEKKNRLTQ